MVKQNIKLLSYFSFLVEFSLYGPVAIIYFSHIAGSYALGASILGITTLVSAFCEVPTGIWSDKVGRRKTVIAGSWMRLLGVICYALGFSYWWLVLGAVFEGLSRAFYSGNNDALLHDTLEDLGQKDDYKTYLGKISSMEQFAVAIGSAIGGIIGSYSFSIVFWLSAIPQLVKLIISYRLIEPSSRVVEGFNIYEHISQAIKLFIKNPKLRLLSISDIISESTGEVSYQFRNAFLYSIWPLWAIGFMSTIVNFLAGLSYYFSGKIIKKWGAEKILLFRAIYARISSIIAYGLPSVYSPLIVITPSAIYGAGQVAKNSLMQEEFTNHQRATMSSLNSLASSLGFGIMSVVVGAFADKFSPASALLVLQIISLPIIYFYYKLFMRSKS